MGKCVAGVIVGLLVASLPAAAQESNFPRLLGTTAAPGTPKPAKARSHKAAEKPKVAATTAQPTVEPPTAPEPTGSVPKRKKDAPRADKAAPAANSAIPEADRLAIQADLAWLGDYEGAGGGDLDDHTVAAIKAFQKRHGGRETGVLSDAERAALANAVKGAEDAVGWRLVDDIATGARFGLPAKLVPKTAALRNGSRWTSGQGQIQIETFRLHEAALPALFEQEKKAPRTRHVEYSALKPASFAMSGMQGLKKFYLRVQASGTELRGITILYDQATEGTMAAVAVAMSNSFQGFPDPNAGPPPGRKRGVEYGSAVVVGSDGRLLAPAKITDECQSITVPGFGHAERIAEDRTTDLALLRLYGARNLVPVALAPDSAAIGDLTLAGVAEPLAQAGGGAVTLVPARLTQQGVEPAPKPGFAGAAALDTQGRLIGMVELKAPMVAGNGAVSQQATLVPADTIRAFLNVHGIVAAAASGATDQSVMRVICVRK